MGRTELSLRGSPAWVHVNWLPTWKFGPPAPSVPNPRVYWLISLSLVNAPSPLADNHFVFPTTASQYGCGIYTNQGSDSLTVGIVIPAGTRR